MTTTPPTEPDKANGPYRLTDWCPPTPKDDGPPHARRTLWTSRIVVICLTLGFVGLLGRVYQLQAYPDNQIVGLQDSQIGQARLEAMRGGIVDRTGRVLASTRIGYRMFCDPMLIEDRTIFAETIAYTLGYDPVELDMKLSGTSHRRYVLLDDRMDDEQVDLFNDNEMPKGVYIEPVTVRDYPQGQVAGTLIGFVGRDGDGLEGLENYWDDRLTGTAGSYRFLRDYRRRRMWVTGHDYVPFEDGENIRLSIDAYIQRLCEEELARTIEEFGADSGQIIVMQPNTGEVLAIATYPTYDPNAFGDVSDEMRRNRPVTDLFEPGSIFKPFVWAGLTEMGVVTPGEVIPTPNSKSWLMPNGRTLHDASAHHNCTWHQVLKYSSNIGMAMVAQRVDVQDVYDIMRSFGFGRPTGIDLPGEISGMLTLSDHAGARAYSQGSWPMGQEVGVTGIQMVRAMCVLANGGVMVDPRIEAWQQLEDEDAPAVTRQRVVSERTASAALYAMRDAVLDGTGRHADSPYFDNFGKTGTAQLPNADTGGYYSDRYMSSFLGGSPTDNPEIVVGVFIRDPDRSIGHYGGVVAAPAFRHVVDQTLLYLGVAPNEGTDPGNDPDAQYEIIE